MSMVTAEIARPMAKDKRRDTSIRVDFETAELIRKASTLKGMTMIEYLRLVLLPIARRDVASEARKIVKAEKPE